MILVVLTTVFVPKALFHSDGITEDWGSRPADVVATQGSQFMSTSEKWCEFSRRSGSWTSVGTAEEGEGVEYLVQWAPDEQSCLNAESAAKVFHRFGQLDALKCLAGKQILFYGNSNTRTLYIALEALLRGAKMTSRVAAKQICDNSKSNHSCWAEVSVDGYRPIVMHYVSFVDDLFHEKLPKRLSMIPFVRDGKTDMVVGNSGLNAIQLYDDAVFLRAHKQNAPKLVAFAETFFGPQATFVWHKTTPVCANQPHFRRYRYNAKHWRYRSLDQINRAVELSNEVVESALKPSRPRLLVIDDWSMLRHQTKGREKDLCPFFEDPLHHRFLDRELVQVLLNEVCDG
jgi:hypothetical protein